MPPAPTTASAARFAVLEVRDLHVAFGNVQAVQGLSLSVRRGEVAALVGPAASGKSTALAALSGLIRPDAGEVLLDGFPITGLSPRAVIRRGLVYVPPGRSALLDMTVEENLLVGAHWRGNDRAIGNDLADVYKRCPELRPRRRARARTLPIGEQLLLAVGRGLMARPRLLMLDEPLAGLPLDAIQRVYALLAGLRQAGLAILLADQRLRGLLDVAQYVYVLERGTLVVEGPAAELAEDVRLQAVVLGSRSSTLRTDDAWAWSVQRQMAVASVADRD